MRMTSDQPRPPTYTPTYTPHERPQAPASEFRALLRIVDALEGINESLARYLAHVIPEPPPGYDEG